MNIKTTTIREALVTSGPNTKVTIAAKDNDDIMLFQIDEPLQSMTLEIPKRAVEALFRGLNVASAVMRIINAETASLNERTK